MNHQRNVLLMTTPVSHVRMGGIARFAKEHGWHLMIADRLSPRAYRLKITVS